jgi:hypothetical protein
MGSSGFEEKKMAPETGLEPVTRRLTAGCSTIELLWNPEGGAIYESTSPPSNRNWYFAFYRVGLFVELARAEICKISSAFLF